MAEKTNGRAERREEIKLIEWRNHLATFVEKPLLRPYFEGRKKLTDDDPNREAVVALVDVRLDVIDGILTYAALRGER
jgi:hypothetical protein